MFACFLNIVIGIWLIVSPSVIDMNKAAANNNYVAGPLVITFAMIALWEINRNVVKLNFVIGLWLLVVSLLIHFPITGIVTNIISGVILILLSFVKRKTSQDYGGGWISLFQHNPPHMQEANRKCT